MQLTCNQLMVLLDIYRGTFNHTRHMGTIESDLNVLFKHKLIGPNGKLTDIGFLRVQSALSPTQSSENQLKQINNLILERDILLSQIRKLDKELDSNQVHSKL